MTRLYRPTIPIEIKCRVLLRRVGELWIDEAVAAHRGALSTFLTQLRLKLAELLNCEPDDLRLDHDPALATRQRIGDGKKTIYAPDANDPDYLIYREKHAHHIKTNIRGDGAQYPDRVLIKRERRRRQGEKHPLEIVAKSFRSKKSTWPKRKLQSGKRPWPKRRMR